MSNIKDLFVGYEIAEQLKEKGFNYPCLKYYGAVTKRLIDLVKGNETVCNKQFINEDVWVSAPLYQQVVDWALLQGVFINVYPVYIGSKQTFSYELSKYGETRHTHSGFKLYYECFNKAIEEAIKLI